jgi:DNA (cytosine-5)-methyltransferase 1
MLKPITYLSVCSGIEAASVAWHPLGWRPWAFSEIDPFPSAVLAHHHGSNMPGEALSANGVPNLGDMTKFEEWPDGSIDLLVGGTPCQDYSVAGKRAGMAGDRGALTLTFLEIARRYRPTWIVWENVPGVLSSNKGRDFATFLRDLGELGYGWAYRVLDAQYVRTCSRPYAVPQRRRRVFVVGYLGDWRPPAAVFLEPEGLRGDPAPSRESGKGFAHDVACSIVSSGRGFERAGETRGQDPGVGMITMAHGQGGAEIGIDHGPTLTCNHEAPIVAHTLKGEGFDASEDGTGRGISLVPVAYPAAVAGALSANGGTENKHGFGMGQQDWENGYAVPVAFDCKGSEAQSDASGVTPTLRAMGHAQSHANAGGQLAVAFAQNNRDEVQLSGGDGAVVGALGAEPGMKQQAYVLTDSAIAFDAQAGGETALAAGDVAGALHGGGKHGGRAAVATRWAVRRLTPMECERLQGFPDGYTLVSRRGKPAADGPRYKALGNSMAVNAMEYIGRRIELVREVMAEDPALAARIGKVWELGADD